MFKINIITKNNKHFKKKIVLFIIFILYVISFTVVSRKVYCKKCTKLISIIQNIIFLQWYINGK